MADVLFEENEKKPNQSILVEIKDAFMTGITYIIPLIIAGGMTSALVTVFSQGSPLVEDTLLWYMKQMGSQLSGTLMLPVLSAATAYALSGKESIAAGFAGGIAANLIQGGFLCAVLSGLIAGYLVRFVVKTIPAKGNIAAVIKLFVRPVLSTVLIGLMVFLIIGKPMAALNMWFVQMLTEAGDTNIMLLGALIGIMVSFDLGGPVSKAAYAFCIGAMTEGIGMPYAAFASAKMVSGFTISASTKIKKKLFTEEEKEMGNSGWILALAGIPEGGIPFILGDPVRVIISLCSGSAITGAIVAATGMGLFVPGIGLFSMFVLQEGVGLIPNAVIWFMAAVVGAVFSTIILLILRTIKVKKEFKK